MKFTKGSGRRGPAALMALVLLAAALVLSACGSSSSNSGSGSSGSGSTTSSSGNASGLKPVNSGKLTVGMNLQFRPEMYLQGGQPAGYDVELLRLLAPAAGVRLNIQNLDFNGLIPGLQAKKFDMVSVGLSATPQRRAVVDFTRPYVPYAQIVGVPAGKAATTTSVAQLNQKGRTIVALQGSTAETTARREFPNANVESLPDQNAAFLQVATGRADAIVVEDYLLAQFTASNSGRLAQAAIARPLDVEYGSYAVPKGNGAFVAFVNRWLCQRQNDGTLARVYEQQFGVRRMPPMPACTS